MMIDFEDREPGPALSLGERVALVLFSALTITAIVSQALTLWSWLAALFA